MERYEGTKLERLRDLFEQVVSAVPTESAAEFYLKYAKAEEKFGLLRHAASIYDRATRAVPEENKLDMYRIYIKKVEQHFGLTKTRPIYERAITELPDDMTRQLCLEFAEMERKLGEVDRARAILTHGSQFADPRTEQQYWKVWREFEEAHGNEDTFRDMLRVKRSVEMALSNVRIPCAYDISYHP
jgi:pre-mRNA-splicing factor SYF1